MAVGSGIGGQVGFAPESTWGTYVAPTLFKQGQGQIKWDPTIVQGGGLAAGRLMESGNQRVTVRESASGTFSNMEVSTTKMGFFAQHIMGSSASPVQQGGSAAYLQTHNVADNYGKSFTAQTGIPERGGTSRPYTGLGGKFSSAEFSCSNDGLLTMSLEADFKEMVETETLASASYVAAVPFHFADMTVKTGTFGAEASVTGVRSASWKIERGMDTEGFYAGASGLKSQQVMNAFLNISGSLEIDFVNKADFVDWWHAQSGKSLILEWQKPTAIAATYYPFFRITTPQVFLDGETPGLDGPEVNRVTIPFKAQYDETNAYATIGYQSTDTTIP